MLPGAIAAAPGAVGVTGSNALVAALSPIAEPLFIASAVLILVAALACSRLVVALAAAGTTLLYLSMFQLATVPATDATYDAMSMMSTQSHNGASTAHADAATFYLGLVGLVAAAVLAAWRYHHHACRPVVHLPGLRIARR